MPNTSRSLDRVKTTLNGSNVGQSRQSRQSAFERVIAKSGHSFIRRLDGGLAGRSGYSAIKYNIAVSGRP